MANTKCNLNKLHDRTKLKTNSFWFEFEWNCLSLNHWTEIRINLWQCQFTKIYTNITRYALLLNKEKNFNSRNFNTFKNKNENIIASILSKKVRQSWSKVTEFRLKDSPRTTDFDPLIIHVYISGLRYTRTGSFTFYVSANSRKQITSLSSRSVPELPRHRGRKGNNGLHRILHTSQGRLQMVRRAEEVEGKVIVKEYLVLQTGRTKFRFCSYHTGAPEHV